MPPEILVFQPACELERNSFKGYPDGTFKPQAEVTYAESLAMIIRALGYEPTLKGSWPTKYLIKAAELDISKGVTVNANAPALRGDVAVFVDNSLDVPKVVQVGFGDEAKYVVSGTEGTKEQTLLGNNLGCTLVEGTVTDAGVLFDSDLAAGKIKVKDEDGKSTTYTLTDDVDPATLVGLEIKAWANSDDEIFMVTDVKDEDVKGAYVYQIDKVGKKIRFGKAGDYKEYSFATDSAGDVTTTIVCNYKITDWADLDAAVASSDYTYAKYLVKDRKVVYLNIVQYDKPQIVEGINTKYEEIRLKTGSSIDYGDVEYTLTKDGKAAKVEDLEENDVLYAWHDADKEKYVIAAFSNTATGTFESGASNWSTITIDEKDYKVIRDYYLSKDEGANFDDNPANIADYLGTDVTLYLGFDGKVVAISGKPAAVAENYGLVSAVYAWGPNDEDVYVTIYDAKGKKKNVKTTSKTKFNGSRRDNWNVVGTADPPDGVKGYVMTAANEVTDLDAGGPYYLVKYSLTDAGDLEAISTVTVDKDDASLTVDKDNDRITADDGAGKLTLVYKSSTVIWDIKGDNAVESVPWSSVEKATGTLANPIKGSVVKGSGNVAKVIVLNSYDTLLAATDVAMVTGLTKTGSSSWRLTLDIKGESKTYNFDEVDIDTLETLSNSNWGDDDDVWTSIKKGNIVEVASDGTDLTSVEEVEAANTYEYAVIRTISASDKLVEFWYDANSDGIVDAGETVEYFGDSKTAVYDCTGSDPAYVAFEDLRRGDLVQYYLSGGVLRWVKIVKPDLDGKIMGDVTAPVAPTGPEVLEARYGLVWAKREVGSDWYVTVLTQGQFKEYKVDADSRSAVSQYDFAKPTAVKFKLSSSGEMHLEPVKLVSLPEMFNEAGDPRYVSFVYRAKHGERGTQPVTVTADAQGNVLTISFGTGYEYTAASTSRAYKVVYDTGGNIVSMAAVPLTTGNVTTESWINVVAEDDTQGTIVAVLIWVPQS